MKRELLMESLLGETRLAVIEDGRLCELFVERPGAEAVAGSVCLGRVENVVPGMNAAFVDIGQAKNGFLSAGDIPTALPGAPRIEALVKPGQSLLVQVMKAQSGQKGHRLSGRITLPGRLLALMPQERCVGVSHRIDDPAERERLQGIGQALLGEARPGLILRTAAAGAEAADIGAEYRRLAADWSAIQDRAAHATAPAKLYDNDSLLLRCARDMLDGDTEAVWADGQALYEALRGCAATFSPALADRVRLFDGDTPLFDLNRVDRQLDRALGRYVWLDSGGSLVIDETEAMTVIDVNTGKFTGKRDVEETLFRINCEAAAEVIRQLRLRDIGGIVIVDFIDMKDASNNDRLLERLKTLTKADRNRLTVVGMTGLGLVELTRKRQRKSLSRQLLHTCTACGGSGLAPSHETTARRAARELWRRRRGGDHSPLLVEATEKAAGWMQTIGAPEGGRAYVAAREMPPGEYAISPADESRLPQGAKLLK